MAVFFLCRFCGQEHLFPVKFNDRKLFEQTQIVARVLRCPVKPERGMYWRTDLYWRDSNTPAKAPAVADPS